MKINFSNSDVREMFSDEAKYMDFSQLMYDTAHGKQQVTKEEANDKIRELMFSVLGVDSKCNRKELRKAIRRHKVDVFEVIEETVENLLITGWGENPFFKEFVEIKNLADGDTNEFYVEDEVILTVSEVSGNHHDLIRQKLGEGDTFAVKTGWYGIKIYTEYELFMAGKVDWAKFVQKIYEAFDKKINTMVYTSIMSAGSSLPSNSQFNKTSQLTTATKATFIELVDDVGSANGTNVVVMGTKTALSKFVDLCDADWISDKMKQERNTTGRLAVADGITLVEIPQAFADGDTTTKLVSNSKLLVMPVADNKFIKIFNEGDAQINEVSDGGTNKDKTIEYEYQLKMGVATIIGRLFGVWNISA